MKILLPELCLIVLIGPSGSGKSTFARTHFKPTEVLSSDYCRGLVCDDETSLEASADAFDVLRFVIGKRLTRGLLSVVDATNVQPEARRPLVELAREHDVLAAAIVLDMPVELCQQRNQGRADRGFGPHVIRRHAIQLRKSLRGLEREGFRYVHVLKTPEQVAEAVIERQRLWNNRQDDHGPFDIIGDIHGCFDELIELLNTLGYDTGDPLHIVPPVGRKVVFLGDLVDRGPKSPEVLELAWSMVEQGNALCIPGNHDVKLLKKLQGRDVQIAHGLAQTLEQLAARTPEFREKASTFLNALVGHYVLDGGRLVVAHAGLKQQYIGRASRRVREFALYGETTGETDEYGLPIRHNWAAEYRGHARIIYGHTTVPRAEWLNNTLNIDTGCVFGGSLTALRWPENQIVSVAAYKVYAESRRPIDASAAETGPSAQQQYDDVLDIADVLGKRIVTTRLHHNVTIREENAIAALEVMSRFAVDPHWLIYLPPTMSPPGTSDRPGLLEHPSQAFDYYRTSGVAKVICEEKHMGSRAVVVLCRDEQVAMQRFGVHAGERGIIYTRTGRRFFDAAIERQMLELIGQAATESGLWDQLETDWICLDCELMPWSAKARELLRTQYAAVGCAGRAMLDSAVTALEVTTARLAGQEAGEAATALLEDHRQRRRNLGGYVDAYRHYCWPVVTLADLKLAPFHLLASEGHVHVDRDHDWHMQILSTLAAAGAGSIVATPYCAVDVTEPDQVHQAIEWWESLTSRGGEGMVVKPREFVVRGPRGLVQPAVKCRGKEYLRLIYGPQYDAPDNLRRLRSRGLGAKRSLALREFALGVEALERFVRREPLRRVHECVFGVLASESEPVDPRL